MVHVIGASSLDRALKFVNPDLKNFATTLPGLSFGNRNLCKNFEFLLRGKLGKKNQIVIWHDVLNNSVTPHSSNNGQPLTTGGLITRLKSLKNLAAVVYCSRYLAPDIYEDLRRAGLVVISVTRNLISKRKQSIPWIRLQYVALHQNPVLEVKSLEIVWKTRRI